MQAGPFLHAFLWQIAIPLARAVLVQLWARRSAAGERASAALGLLPVPATALVVLLIVSAAVVPQLGQTIGAAIRVVPIYISPPQSSRRCSVARRARREAGCGSGAGAGVSAATRNSLVVLPLALAVPGAMPLRPAIIVAQTLVELVFFRIIPKLGSKLPRLRSRKFHHEMALGDGCLSTKPPLSCQGTFERVNVRFWRDPSFPVVIKRQECPNFPHSSGAAGRSCTDE